VSSSDFQGNFGPLAVADEICQKMLPVKYKNDNRVMRAWISGESYDAGTRFLLGKGRYLLPDDQTIIVNRGEDLLNGILINSISMTEKNEILNVPVWTNTDSNGSKISSIDNCNGWATNSVFEVGWYGWSGATDFQWTRREVLSNPEACSFYAHIYCVEQANQ
jgi:hypothetical protein